MTTKGSQRTFGFAIKGESEIYKYTKHTCILASMQEHMPNLFSRANISSELDSRESEVCNREDNT